MIHTIFNFKDLISTTVLLVSFLALFFLMINMIKKMKSTAPLPPEETLQQKVDNLTTRVKALEHRVENLSEKQ